MEAASSTAKVQGSRPTWTWADAAAKADLGISCSSRGLRRPSCGAAAPRLDLPGPPKRAPADADSWTAVVFLLGLLNV